MAGIGDLVVNLAMDTRQFTKGARTAQSTNQQLARQVRQSLIPATDRFALAEQKLFTLFRTGQLTMRQYNTALGQLKASQDQAAASAKRLSAQQSRVGMLSTRNQMVMTQLAFGVEDAAVSFGTGGLQGALRGASNNLTFIAATLGGAGGAMAAVALVAATQLVPAILKATGVIGAEDEALKSLNAELERLSDNSREAAERGVGRVEQQHAIRDVGRADSSEQAAQMAEAASDAQETLQAELAASEELVNSLRGRMNLAAEAFSKAQQEHTRTGAGLLGIGGPDEDEFQSRQIKIEEELRKALKEREELQRKIADQRERELAAAEKIPMLRLNELEEERRAKLEKEREERQKNAEKQQQEAERVEKERKRQAERANREQERTIATAESLRRGIVDDIDPDKGRSARRGIFRELQDRLKEISELGLPPAQRAGFERGAKIAAASQLARLDDEDGPGPDKPVASLRSGSREALMSVLQGQLTNKQTPKESTQQKIEKHLQVIEKAMKGGQNGLLLGLIRGGP